MSIPSLLLHICCGPCASHAVRVVKADYAVTGFFSNSNIHPRSEYDHRLSEARRLAELCDIPLVEDTYRHDEWLAAVSGLEKEPERGARCDACFRFNLARAATYANAHFFDLFTTTLTISPHKDSRKIFGIGHELGSFLEVDFKKKDGFRKSLQLSRHYELYRQSFCGCEFSRRSDDR
ncbi:MAG: epoxyqueuosine reductase QueH [Candidatus Pacebacteria bacterium]|nr:epoxyqueuosine reductase QueH [Candidatus Paceibacterota bacterium]